MKSAKSTAREPVRCPVSGLLVHYAGKGRPAVYHERVTKGARRAHAAGRQVRKNAEGLWVVAPASK